MYNSLEMYSPHLFAVMAGIFCVCVGFLVLIDIRSIILAMFMLIFMPNVIDYILIKNHTI